MSINLLPAQIESPLWEVYEDLRIDNPFWEVYEDMKGDVQTLRYNRYYAKMFFGNLEKIESNNEYSLAFNFDEHNKISSVQRFPAIESFKISYSNDTTCEIIFIENKIILKEVYITNSRKQVLEHTKWQNDTITEIEIAQFNSNDSLVEYKKYGKSGALITSISKKYDSKNRLIEKVSYRQWGASTKSTFEYSRDNLSKISEYDINGNPIRTTLFRYNELNMLTEISMTPVDPNEKFIKNVYYYENGLLYRIEEFESSDGKKYELQKKQSFKYDSKKNKTEVISLSYYLDQVNFKMREYYTYDVYGRINNYEWYRENAGEGVFAKHKEMHEYDSHGSKIKETAIYAVNPEEAKLPFEVLDHFIQENIIIYR
jgi:hypothetical protein